MVSTELTDKTRHVNPFLIRLLMVSTELTDKTGHVNPFLCWSFLKVCSFARFKLIISFFLQRITIKFYDHFHKHADTFKSLQFIQRYSDWR